MKILIVGGGLSGSLASYFLRNTRAKITCWEKSFKLGGRAASKRNSAKTGQIDTGLQYLTKYQSTKTHAEIYDKLLSAEVIKPFQIQKVQNFRDEAINQSHYTATNGARSLSEFFMSEASSNIVTSKKLDEIKYDESKKSATASTTCGHSEEFDLVLVTIPAPQVLADISIIPPVSEEKVEMLQNIRYSNRFVLGCFYNSDVKLPTEHVAGYSKGVIRYWAIDNQKRNAEGTTSVLLHTKTDFCPEMTKEEIVPVLMEEFTKMFPDFPAPEEVVGHKWKYSQPVSALGAGPGYLFVHDRVALFGDGFARCGNFDGCVQSASALSKYLIKTFEL